MSEGGCWPGVAFLEGALIDGFEDFELVIGELIGCVFVGGDDDFAGEELLEDQANGLELIRSAADREANAAIGAVLSEDHDVCRSAY